MLETLKKLDKKFLIIGSILLLAPILLIIVLVSVQACSNIKIPYSKYQDRMIEATEKYLKAEKKISDNEAELVTIDLKTLVSKGYIKDPNEIIDDTNCKGKVYVRLNGSTVEENEGGFYNYIPKLSCKKYNTNSLKSVVLKDLTTTGSGVYQQNGEYIYRGDEAKNRIKFFGKDYRIVSIGEDGLAKLIKEEPEIQNRYWDIKYNTEVASAYGKNIYKDSYILKQLKKDYITPKVISKKAKKHIVSRNVCIGVRDIKNISINNENECNSILELQPVSLINVTDFAKASLDSECNSIISKSCRNYNYFKTLDVDSWTMTAVSNNTYEVYYVDNGIIKYEEASMYHDYNLVIYVDSNEIVKSGKGTENVPYVIE